MFFSTDFLLFFYKLSILMQDKFLLKTCELARFNENLPKIYILFHMMSQALYKLDLYNNNNSLFHSSYNSFLLNNFFQKNEKTFKQNISVGVIRKFEKRLRYKKIHVKTEKLTTRTDICKRDFFLNFFLKKLSIYKNYYSCKSKYDFFFNFSNLYFIFDSKYYLYGKIPISTWKASFFAMNRWKQSRIRDMSLKARSFVFKVELEQKPFSIPSYFNVFDFSKSEKPIIKDLHKRRHRQSFWEKYNMKIREELNLHKILISNELKRYERKKPETKFSHLKGGARSFAFIFYRPKPSLKIDDSDRALYKTLMLDTLFKRKNFRGVKLFLDESSDIISKNSTKEPYNSLNLDYSRNLLKKKIKKLMYMKLVILHCFFKKPLSPLIIAHNRYLNLIKRSFLFFKPKNSKKKQNLLIQSFDLDGEQISLINSIVDKKHIADNRLNKGITSFVKSMDLKKHYLSVQSILMGSLMNNQDLFIFFNDSYFFSIKYFFNSFFDKFITLSMFSPDNFWKWIRIYCKNLKDTELRNYKEVKLINFNKIELSNFILPTNLKKARLQSLLNIKIQNKTSKYYLRVGLLLHNFLGKIWSVNTCIVWAKLSLSIISDKFRIKVIKLCSSIRLKEIRPLFKLEFISIIVGAFLTRDPNILLVWIYRVLEKISFKLHLNFILTIRKILLNMTEIFFFFTDFSGLYIVFKGKIGQIGSVRKRSYNLRIGRMSTSNTVIKGDNLYSYSLTNTGKIGVKIIFGYN